MASINIKKRIRDLLTLPYHQDTKPYFGLPDLVTDADLVADIFDEPTYNDADRTRISAFFGADPPKVLEGYPRQPKDFPAVILQRTGDGEKGRQPAGQLIGYDEESEDLHAGTEVYGAFMGEQIRIEIWAYQSPSMRDDIYLAVRELMLRGYPYLLDAGITEPRISTGRDGEMPLDEANKHIIHQAEFLLTYNSEVTWTKRVPKVLDVRSSAKVLGQGHVTASEHTE